MTMNIAAFHRLLDAHGADRSRWPADCRHAAERLIAADPAAAAAFVRAQALDTLIARQLHRENIADAAAARLSSTLDRPLPAQHGGLFARWWPSELLEVDFTPAWPRIAALAAVGLLGFAIGLANPDVTMTPRSRFIIASASPDSDLSSIVFEPDGLSEIRP
jgi:anti-sigma factor RsiW